MNIQTKNRHNHNNKKNGDGPQRGAVNISEAKDQPTVKIMSRRQDHGPHKDDEQKKNKKNRHKLNHNLCVTYPFLSVCNEYKNKCNINQELVVLSKHRHKKMC